MRTGVVRLAVLLTALAQISTTAADSVAPRIVEGMPVPTSKFPTVGIVEDNTHAFSCTGTLIDPTHVLTAGHCAMDESTGLPLAQDAGRFMLGGMTYKSSRITVHPSFNTNLIGMDGVFDAAIFTLERAVTNVTPSAILRQPPVPGTAVTLVGYGLIGTSGKTGTLRGQPPPGTVFVGTNSIQTVTQTELIWTFTPGTSSNAPGDSGGPAFIDLDGTMVIAGITSLGETIGGNKIKFGAKNFDTRIDTLAPWIDLVLSGTSLDIPPSIVSPITVDPNPVLVGDSAQFTVAATDPDDTNLFYLWNFGDGTASSGPVVGHTYVFPGTYSVSVTVSDIVTGVTSNANVVVQPQGTGTMNIDKLQIGLNFSSFGRDSINMQATLQPLSSVTALPSVGVLSVGDVQLEFTLDQRGKGKTSNGTFQLNLQKGTFKATIRNGTFAQLLSKNGLINADVFGAQVVVPVGLLLNGISFSMDKTLTYSAKADKFGKAK
jgi:hypothetical protein